MRTLRDGRARAALFRRDGDLPAVAQRPRARELEAQAAGAALAVPPGLSEQPELAAAALARLAENDGLRERVAGEARSLAGQDSRTLPPSTTSSTTSGAPLKRLESTRSADPLADREWILADLHMHRLVARLHDRGTPTCSTTPRRSASGAIAVIDHNVFGGALEAIELAEGATSSIPVRRSRPTPRAR